MQIGAKLRNSTFLVPCSLFLVSDNVERHLIFHIQWSIQYSILFDVADQIGARLRNSTFLFPCSIFVLFLPQHHFKFLQFLCNSFISFFIFFLQLQYLGFELCVF